MRPPASRNPAFRSWAAGAAQALLLVASPALAQAPPGDTAQDEAEPSGFFDGLWTRDYLLGFGPGRGVWEDNGINVDLYYNAYFGWNAKGGANSGATGYSHSFDLFVRADTERMGLWSGGMALLLVKNSRGRNINPDVGALSQVVDDADFTEFAYLDQLYYEHGWRRNTVRFRAGYLDYQTIIDRNAYANMEDVQFMNAALDNNLLVPLKIGFGATLFVDPTDWLGIIVGTSDAENEIRNAGWDTAFGDASGLMGYGEVTLRSRIGSSGRELSGNYRLGLYYDPRTRPVFGALEDTTGTLGAWLSFDQMVYRESPDDRQGVGLFYRYGRRAQESYAIPRFHSGGLEYRGPLPRRDTDAFGIGVYHLVPSDDFRDNVSPDFVGETGYEAYYRAQVSPWLAISQGVQYIENPGGLSSDPDALALVLRLRTRF